MDANLQRIQELEAQVSKLEQEKARLQEKIDDSLDAGPELLQPDKDLDYYEDKVARINQMISDWARECATVTASPWQELGEFERWHSVNDIVGKVVVWTEGDVPAVFQGPRRAKLLLDTLTANHVYFSIFAVPFFSTPDYRMQNPGGLDWLYRELSKESPSMAYKWRSMTRTVLGHPDLRQQILEMVQKAATMEAEIFLKSEISFLLNKGRLNEYTAQLTKIFLSAAEVNHHVWIEDLGIECKALVDCVRLNDDETSWVKDMELERGSTLADALRMGKVVLFTRPQMEIVQYVVEDETTEEGTEGEFLLSELSVWVHTKDEEGAADI